MNEFTVVVNDCVAVAAMGGPISIRSRTTELGQRNFLLSMGSLVSGLRRQLNEREMDLAETAAHIFAIDLACVRGRGDVAWSRSIEAHLPVRDPDYWNGISSRLGDIFGDLTHDRLNLKFYTEDRPAEPPRQRKVEYAPFDCVALVSGGVDSFVGGLDLVHDGRRPLGISHAAAGATVRAQGNVASSIASRLSTFERAGFTAKKSGAAFPGPEPSQRSRSFLFLSMASIAASVGEVGDVFINENGIMAIHAPMTSARIGSLSTHTAAPAVLERIQLLLGDVLGTPINIRNRLLPYTKPEVVGIGNAFGARAELAQTVSCWSIGRTGRHCGVCAPCLMRRISFEIHSVPDVAYEADPFNEASLRQSGFALDNLTHMLRLVRDVNVKSDLDLQLTYPELLSGGSALTLADSIALHRRWANEASTVLGGYPTVAGMSWHA